MAETGYCLKCKTEKEMKNEQKIGMKNSQVVIKGTCSDCGTDMYKVLPRK